VFEQGGIGATVYPPRRWGRKGPVLASSGIAAVVIVIAMTAFVVIAVIGLHVWGAIQDGREEKAMWSRRHPPE